MTQTPLLSILQAVLIAILGLLGRMIWLVLREVRAINGRIVRLEEWRNSMEGRNRDADARMSRMEDWRLK